jgi:Putative Ig domain
LFLPVTRGRSTERAHRLAGRLILARLALLAAVAALCAFGISASAATQRVQHVTLIGDSVADAVRSASNAVSILNQEVDLDLEVAPCRRVDGQSCSVQGVQPMNVVDLADSMGSKLGPNVVVAVGYNDFEDQYAQNIEHALAAFHAAGVTHVWWLTLRAAHHPYLNMNDDIVAAARQHPEMSVIDWNMYSRSHPDWFQSDGLHLLDVGAVAMATLIHRTLVAAGVAPPPVAIVTTELPAAKRGKRYAGQLRATNGAVPYRWSLLARPPKGIHLESSGAVIGRPEAPPGWYSLSVRVVDASGLAKTRTITLRIRR